ncbi:MFS transporter [Spirillospora sp. NPDC029432]|uniref:MFS transporter n=1 Tax=Spirillospora sp. NPDC029432 TaxID=3154599 RepID=UPI003451DFD4
MPDEADETRRATPPKQGQPVRAAVSSFLGATIEYYDFLLYAQAAVLVFGPVFFRDLPDGVAALASLGTFTAGYLARPVGGLIFGHFGDRLGRKKMLVLSLVLMGAASTAIGLIPPPSVIGYWGAVILILLRVCQGIAVGGEWGGAALLSYEHADTKRRGFSASFTQAGAPTGVALAGLMLGLFAALPEDEFQSWGWRIPFLLSIVLLLLGLVVRAGVRESPEFEDAVERGVAGAGSTHRPLRAVLRRPRPVLICVFGTFANFFLTGMIDIFGLAYTVDAGTPKHQALTMWSVASVFQIFSTIAMGYISDKVGRVRVMVIGYVSYAVLLYPMFHLFSQGDQWAVLGALLLSKTVHSVVYGPLAAFVADQFTPENRYTGGSVGYQVASQLGNGVGPLLITALYAATGQNVASVVAVGAASCLMSAAVVFSTTYRRGGDRVAPRSPQLR